MLCPGNDSSPWGVMLHTSGSPVIAVLAHKSSKWFRIGVWIFAALTFADAANLDDLVSSSVILHSDEEATAGALRPAADPGITTNPGPLSVGVHRPPAHTHDSGVVILDQDSPSLEAETALSDEVFLPAPPAETVSLFPTAVPDLLYLRFHVLLL